MKLLKIQILFILLSSTTILFNCTNNPNSIDVNNWKILFKNTTTLNSIASENKWSPIQNPIKFTIPGNSSREFKYIWLKGSFNIKDNPEKYYGLSTGRMRLADKIFINNRLIGSLSPEKVNWRSAPRNYKIPSGLLNEGINNIYISLGIPDIHGMYTGGISGNISINSKDDFYKSEFINNLLYNQFPFGIGLLVLGFMTVSLILYIWNRKEKLYLYFVGILLYNIIFSFISLPLCRFFGFKLFHTITVSTPIIAWVFLILSIQTIYRKYLSNYNRIIIPALLFFAIFNFIFYDTIPFSYIIKIPALLFIMIVIPYFIFILYQFNLITKSDSNKPDKYLIYVITTSLIIIGIIPVFDTFYYFNGYSFSGFTTIFIPPIGLILFAIFVGKESMNRQVEIDRLYRKLELFEIQDRGQSLTDISENKLEQVVDFIKENYTQEISREGLASAVDMNPDYMSRLFRTYTGMKVSEYINKLRVEEAAMRLKNEKIRVIDIAFAVGFVNTISFNRKFKAFTGLTPSEYRNKFSQQ